MSGQNSDANDKLKNYKKRNCTKLRDEPNNMKDTYAEVVKKDNYAMKEKHATETAGDRRKILHNVNRNNTKDTKSKKN